MALTSSAPKLKKQTRSLLFSDMQAKRVWKMGCEELDEAATAVVLPCCRVDSSKDGGGAFSDGTGGSLVGSSALLPPEGRGEGMFSAEFDPGVRKWWSWKGNTGHNGNKDERSDGTM